MEVNKAIRTAYFNALNGVISVDVYDSFAIPDNANKPYVIISSQTKNQLLIKRCKRWNASVLLDIVTVSGGR